MFKDYFDKITWQGVLTGVVICSLLGGGIAIQESVSFGAPVRKNRKKNPKRRRRVSTKKRSNPKRRKSSKRRRNASPYNKFVGKQMRAGKSMKQAARAWKNR